MDKRDKLKELEDAFNFFDSPKGYVGANETEEETKKNIEEDAKKRALRNLQGKG